MERGEDVFDSLKRMLAEGDDGSDDEEDNECEFQDEVVSGKK